MKTPVRPFPALQCTTTVLRASAARYAAASVQKLCRSARGGACHKRGVRLCAFLYLTKLEHA